MADYPRVCTEFRVRLFLKICVQMAAKQFIYHPTYILWWNSKTARAPKESMSNFRDNMCIQRNFDLQGSYCHLLRCISQNRRMNPLTWKIECSRIIIVFYSCKPFLAASHGTFGETHGTFSNANCRHFLSLCSCVNATASKYYPA